MAKVQKTFYLNTELHALMEAYQEATGVSFTKILHAGIVQYLLGDFPRVDPLTMKLVDGLEKGTLSLSTATLRVIEDQAHRREMVKAELTDLGTLSLTVRPIHLQVMGFLHEHSAKKMWNKAFDDSSDPLAMIVACLTERKHDKRPT